MKAIKRIIIAVAAALAIAGAADAQYTPINPSASGATLRQSIDNRFSGANEITPYLSDTTRIKNMIPLRCVTTDASGNLVPNLCNAGSLAGNPLIVNQASGSIQDLTGSINKTINPQAYPYLARASNNPLTCSTTNGSPNVTISGVGDYINGDAVVCAHALDPAANTVVGPSTFTATAISPDGAAGTSWTYKICTLDAVTGQISACQTSAVNNASYLNDGFFITNTAWAAAHAYSVGDLIVDSNHNIQKCTTAGTSQGSAPTWATTIGAITTENVGTTNVPVWTMYALGDGHSNMLKWTKGSSGTATAIYNQTGLIGLIPIGVQYFRDVGQAVESFYELPTTAPASALGGRLATTISSGGGTTSLVLGANATATVSGQHFNHNTQPALVTAWAAAVTNGTALYLPTGAYPYYGAALDDSAALWNISGTPPVMSQSSDAQSSSVIYVAAGGYFIDTAADVVQSQIYNLTQVGGLGMARFRSTAALGIGQRMFYNNSILDHTGCAVCWNEADQPYHYVFYNHFRGLDNNATKGYGFGGNNDSSMFFNNTFNKERIGLTDRGKGFGRQYKNMDVIHGGSPTGLAPFSRAGGWLSGSTNGTGWAQFEAYRGGNEGLRAGDYHILVAAADAYGTDLETQFPVAPHANYGVGDFTLDGVGTNGSRVIISASAHFNTTAHTSDWVRLAGAGKQGECACELIGQINTIDADNQITLTAGSPTASATVSGAMLTFGTPMAASMIVQQVRITGSTFVSGTIVPAPAPIFSTATLSGWSFDHNTLNTPSATGPIFDFLLGPAGTRLAKLNQVINNIGAAMGTASDSSLGMFPSNNTNAVTQIDPLQLWPVWDQPGTYPLTSNQAGVIDFIPSTQINSYSLGTNVTKVTLASLIETDRAGGTDGAEVRFTDSASQLIHKTFTPSALGLSWLTFDMRKPQNAGHTPVLRHIFVNIADSVNAGCCAGGTLVSRQLAVPAPTADWTTISIPWVPLNITDTIDISFQPVYVTGSNTTPETGYVEIGRVHVYQADFPVDLSANEPVVLSALPTCNASYEGTGRAQNNSTAACSAGATATNAGTTHCQLYCDGSAWKQTGR